jgi:hypothetical protein
MPTDTRAICAASLGRNLSSAPTRIGGSALCNEFMPLTVWHSLWVFVGFRYRPWFQQTPYLPCFRGDGPDLSFGSQLNLVSRQSRDSSALLFSRFNALASSPLVGGRPSFLASVLSASMKGLLCGGASLLIPQIRRAALTLVQNSWSNRRASLSGADISSLNAQIRLLGFGSEETFAKSKTTES